MHDDLDARVIHMYQMKRESVFCNANSMDFCGIENFYAVTLDTRDMHSNGYLEYWNF